MTEVGDDGLVANSLALLVNPREVTIEPALRVQHLPVLHLLHLPCEEDKGLPLADSSVALPIVLLAPSLQIVREEGVQSLVLLWHLHGVGYKEGFGGLEHGRRITHQHVRSQEPLVVLVVLGVALPVLLQLLWLQRFRLVQDRNSLW